MDRCHINELRTTSSTSFIRSTSSALLFKPTHLKLSPSTSLQVSVHSPVRSITIAIIRLQRILPPKMPFFVYQKVQIWSKILLQILNCVILQCTILVYLLIVVKFRQKSIFWSRRPVFVILSVFLSETKSFGAYP